ncbi:MAG: ferredoxin [Planctomycetota bacterium]|jgi:ferredoxin
MAIKRVWIEEGCISCNLCEDLCPEVFEVPVGGECRTKKGHQKLLKGDAELDEKIEEAHMDCPVEVIQIEKG